MKKQNELLKELEEAAGKLNIRLRYEKTKARGGLCRINDETVIIIDRNASPIYKTQVIAECLRGFDLDDVFLSPRAREAIETAD
ncbi:hypothetical protein [Limisalsivibrio acetivorans]|uniref:hypothetical protein n=1 Tax=Limisalsivibrio acetivorans TaxID=1304888 RepID=UPI000414CA88|nr:hypothetical protein [Limisalsivibrio acetivorans]